MNILLIGAGMVGREICASLVKENHNITVIDTDESMLNEISNTFDIQTIKGNGTDIETLRSAGVGRMNLVVACAEGDETNILCCAAAKKLGAGHTIARVRNPELGALIELMKDEIGLSVTINPELTAAKEIYRMLRFPSAAKLDTFCRGKVEMAQYIIPDGSILIGSSLNDLRNKLGIGFLVCSVLRGDDAFIPSGTFTLLAGDRICITSTEEEIANFYKAIGAYKRPVRNVLIAGGGRITYYLEQFLENANIQSTVIERNKALCLELASRFSCTAICDNPTKQELLLEEGIENVDALLALSSVDEENAIVSMFAKSKKVDKIVTLIGTLPYIDFFKSVGLDSVISPKSSMASFVVRYARATVVSQDSEMESLHKIMDGKVEAIEFIIKNDIPGITGLPIKQLNPRKGVLIVCIVRKGKVIIPSGNDMIMPDDTVITVSSSGKMSTFRDILD